MMTTGPTRRGGSRISGAETRADRELLDALEELKDYADRERRKKEVRELAELVLEVAEEVYKRSTSDLSKLARGPLTLTTRGDKGCC
jgi:hypothetical protein